MIKREKVIREAILEDMDRIVKLLYQLSPLKGDADPTKLKAILEHMLVDSNYDLIVCECEGNIIGTAALVTIPNLTYGGKSKGLVENVVTDKDNRGKGIGKKMVEKLIEIGKNKNYYKIILDCETNNVTFYEKCGFYTTGEVEMRLDMG
ncbi:MAG: GNAT family N-acetyltransferase [Nanoarchaeota archaeon]|nr:GNAT family N-acetyltransferase [Nanoarchaeota archaeon]